MRNKTLNIAEPNINQYGQSENIFENEKAIISKFHNSIKFSINQCKICREAWPLKSKPKSPYICRRCSLDKQSPKKFSDENFMIPSSVPDALQDLTQIEEMLIARALPIMKVYLKPGGQRGYSGHCIHLPQRVSDLAQSLPHCPKDIPLIVVTMKGKGNTFKDVIVRRKKVEQALQWLIKHNPQYHSVKVNITSLNSLPVDGVPAELQIIETDNDPEGNLDEIYHSYDTEGFKNKTNAPSVSDEKDEVFNHKTETSTFLPHSDNDQLEQDAIHSRLGTKISWPLVEDQPLSEYTTPFLATMAFPCLFPDGKGDPTNPSLCRDITLGNKIQHLIKFAEFVNGKWIYRFASHPRFSYWALNMIQRKRMMQQNAIFLKQNPEESHLTIDELRNMGNSSTFMSKLWRYASNITGSSSYWYKIREDLKAIIACKGAPTIFFTFSSADMHWPELHSLLDPNFENLTGDGWRKNVINNPHLVDWFFTKRLESFLKHWLYDTLNAEWHWYRYEFQARGSIHCHGTAKLKNDPGLCNLTEIALKGFLAEKCPNDCKDVNILLDIEQGKRASEQVCNYVDSLVSTWNPLPPDSEIWTKPNVHPCKKHHENIVDFESDYTDLLNTVQRHTVQ
jgi:hypothetical protein